MVGASLVPGVFIMKTISNDTDGASGCWLGGEPTLPASIDWPWVMSPPMTGMHLTARERSLTKEYPMHFFAQIDLAEVPQQPGKVDLPTQGTLFFFADYIDHVEINEENPKYRVIYVEDDVSGCPPRSQPPFPDDFDEYGELSCCYWWPENPVTSFHKWPITFANFDDIHMNQFPNFAYWKYAIKKHIERWDGLLKMAEKNSVQKREPLVPKPKGRSQKDPAKQHHLLGIDTPPGSTAAPKPDVVRLLTIQYDDDLNFVYAGQLGFFITADDLALRNFDSVWAFTESS